jgi:polar amino acid transport system substrate-binding protein
VTAGDGATPAPAAPRPSRRWAPIVAVAAVVVVLAVVAVPQVFLRTDVPESLPGPTTTTPTPPATSPPADFPGCDDDAPIGSAGDPTASLRPTGPATPAVAPESYMGTIQQRGRLRVGVSATNLLFSTVDPFTGEFEGFDVDIAKEVAIALFGDANPEHIEFVVIPQTDRVTVLTNPQSDIDMVASTFSITCSRQADIDFSSEYFTSGQRLLVPEEDTAGEVTIDTLAAEAQQSEDRGRVCAAEGSTSIEVLRTWEPRPNAVAPTTHAECLALLQQGQIDAVSTDDTLLAGFKVQDPNVAIVGERLTDEHYGLGLPPQRDEWVRYVNAVLEGVRSSGRWDAIYASWLSGALDEQPPPAAVYSD